MGLDMYMSRKKYMGWNYSKPDEKIPDLSEFDVDSKKVTYIMEEVAYWRKANAIHKWFVDNVQKGIDNCGSYLVSLEDMVKLYKEVKEVINDPQSAEQFLPTSSGFFFGNYEYDEWYFNDLKITKEQVAHIIAGWDESSEYYYQSSW
jgi:hypothetical protein